MALPARSGDQPFTYRDYLGWGEEARYELIDGAAYSMAPAPGVDHPGAVGELFYQLRTQLEGQRCRPFVAPVDVRLPKFGQAGVREYWLVHPTDRLLTVYRAAGAGYAAPELAELTSETPVVALPGVVIRWESIVSLLGAHGA